MDAKLTLEILCSPSSEALSEIRARWNLPLDWQDWEQSGIWWRADHLSHYTRYHVGQMECEHGERVEDAEINTAMEEVLKAIKNLEAIIARKFEAP